MAVWGYARLVGYNERYELVPDILKSVDVTDDGRTFTLHLRRGHKWSDGQPFTTEDLRYWWEDVALNEELSPAGPPVEMLTEGARPKVTVIDEVTIRYEWPKPNPQFLPALAQARPLYIYRPAHYMRRFHARYADPEGLAERVAASGKRNWAALHNYMDALYDFDNPELPVLQPWMNTTDKNSQRYQLVRNPYYHRIDSKGPAAALCRRDRHGRRRRRLDPAQDQHGRGGAADPLARLRRRAGAEEERGRSRAMSPTSGNRAPPTRSRSTRT